MLFRSGDAMSTPKKLYLDDEERDIMESVERGEWQSVNNQIGRASCRERV